MSKERKKKQTKRRRGNKLFKEEEKLQGARQSRIDYIPVRKE